MLASNHGISSLAIPAISTGIFRFPKERAARLIFDAIVDFFNVNPDSSICAVELILFDEPGVRTFVIEWERRWPEDGNSS